MILCGLLTASCRRRSTEQADSSMRIRDSATRFDVNPQLWHSELSARLCFSRSPPCVLLSFLRSAKTLAHSCRTTPSFQLLTCYALRVDTAPAEAPEDSSRGGQGNQGHGKEGYVSVTYSFPMFVDAASTDEDSRRNCDACSSQCVTHIDRPKQRRGAV